MKFLVKLFFLGLDYPVALIYQFILGASVWAVCGFLFFDWDGYGGIEVLYSLIGGFAALILGITLYFSVNGRVK